MGFALPLICGLLATSLAPIGAAVNTVFDRLEAPPRGWDFHSQALHHEPLELHVSLRYQNAEAFEQHALDIATPDHALYGQYLEGHEVDDMLMPHEEAFATVVVWLKEHNITQFVRDREWILFYTTVGTANEMLKTKYSWFTKRDGSETQLRTLEYAVPQSVSRHIDFVHPTLKFPGMTDLKSTIHSIGKPETETDQKAVAEFERWASSAGNLSKEAPLDHICSKIITPQCLLKAYNVKYGAKHSLGTGVAFGSFLGEVAQYKDFRVFKKKLAPYAKGANFKVKLFNGAANNQTSRTPDGEANLDLQYIASVGYPLKVTEYITKGCGPLIPHKGEPAGSCAAEPYSRFLKGVLALPNAKLPNVLSISYGEDEQGWPEKMAKKVCHQFAQLGARGVSVLFSSGDSGPGRICKNNAGTKAQFVPAFPASCPFVTTVGATRLAPPEKAAGFSGGGFSFYFSRPSYQDSAVERYLKILGNQNSKFFNRKGRAYPDVSANGNNYRIIQGGHGVLIFGTSASAPTFSAIIGLLNSARLSIGKKPLGFLNPFLYSKGLDGLTDITEGQSRGCFSNHPRIIQDPVWNATKGWDAATGLGTPNFGKLLKIVAPGVKNSGGVLDN